jgi:hypothetical protein
MRLACHQAPARKSKPKDQRSILADLLLRAESPPSADEIVDQAEKAGYQETFRPRKLIVTMKESVQWHPGRMGYGREVGRDSVQFVFKHRHHFSSLLFLPFHAIEWPL